LGNRQFASAGKDVLRFIKQPSVGLVNYARNTLTNLSSEMKHSAPGRLFAKPLATQSELNSARLKLLDKHNIESDKLERQMQKLGNQHGLRTLV
jgi:hypothetical protein